MANSEPGASSEPGAGTVLEDGNHELRYSPATGPIADTTIRTGSEGLDTRLTTIGAGNRAVRVYAAWPKASQNAPVMLVISEAFGLHAHIADVARRFAHHGYFAVAPDLIARQGDPMRYDNVGTLVKELLLKIPDPQVMSDLDATVAWAASQGGDTGQLAATGFCWDGRWTWLYAAHRSLRVAVVFYGIIDGAGTFPHDPALFPRHPLDVTNDLKGPVLGLYGGKDEAISPASIDAMRTKLREGNAAARASEIHVYHDAPHAFFADYRDSYRTADATDAWNRCLGWFAERI